MEDNIFFISIYAPIIISIPIFIIAYFSYRLQKESHNRIIEREEANYLWEIDDIFGQLKLAFSAVDQVLNGHVVSGNSFPERLQTQNDRCFSLIENGTSRLTNSELRRFAYIFSHASIICKNFEEHNFVEQSSVKVFLNDCNLLVQDYSKKLDKIDNEYNFF